MATARRGATCKVPGTWGVVDGVGAVSRVRRRSGRRDENEDDDDRPGDGLRAFVRDQRGGAVRLATMLVGDRAVAEEIVQDALFELSRRWYDLDNPAAFLRTVLVNRCRNHRRHLGVVRRHAPPPPPPYTDAPELDELWQVLTGLAPRRRAALVLRYYEDLPIAEIARLLGCRPGTVSSLLHRGLADLRKVLSDDT